MKKILPVIIITISFLVFSGCELVEFFADNDGDGVMNLIDECPDDPDKLKPGVCGCGIPEELPPGALGEPLRRIAQNARVGRKVHWKPAIASQSKSGPKRLDCRC